jgi:hypothetical protein
MKMLHPKSGQGYTERLVSEVQKKKKSIIENFWRHG